MPKFYRPPWLPVIVGNSPDPYNPKSCNSLVKIFYTPIEAAIRWCGLIGHEADILRETGDDLFPNAAKFSHWPCLRANTEKIIDACRNGSLIFGNQGVTIKQTESWRITMVAPPYLTIMHTDLKEWMTKHYPDQKPAFLFDEVERTANAALNADGFISLQADHDALKVKLTTLEAEYSAIKNEYNALMNKVDGPNNDLKGREALNERSEKTYHNIIVALLDYIQGDFPGIEKHPKFKSEAQLIEAISIKYRGYGGLSKRNLEDKFGIAKNSFKEQSRS